MSAEQGAAGVTELAPIKEQLNGDVEVFICCENIILSKVTGLESPVFLLSAYYFGSFTCRTLDSRFRSPKEKRV